MKATKMFDTGAARAGQVGAVYRLSKPVEYGYEDRAPTEYVWVSAVPSVGMFGGPETYIFPSDSEGKVLDWGELPGSFQGGMDHIEALTGLGVTELDGKPIKDMAEVSLDGDCRCSRCK